MLTPEQMSQELKGMGGDKTRSLPCCQSLWRKIVLFLFSSHKVKSIPLSMYFQVKSNLHPGFLAFSLNWLSWSRIHLQCRRPGFDPCVGKIPWRRKGLPTPVFWPGEFQGLYRPLGRKESDMTGRLSLHSLTQSKLAQTRNGESEARNLITVLGKIVFFKPAGSLGFPGGSDGKASACNVGNQGSIPGLGRCPGEGKGYPLQYFCLENSMERKACRLQSMWLQSWTQLSDKHALTVVGSFVFYHTWEKCRLMVHTFIIIRWSQKTD